MKKFTSFNPYTYELIKEFEFTTLEQLDQILANAQKGFNSMSSLTVQQRNHKFLLLKDTLQERKSSIAELITQETGKTIVEAEGEITKSIQYIEYITKLSEGYFSDQVIEHSVYQDVKIQICGLGCILKICPFNFPFWVVFKGLMAIMLAGNSIIFRPSDSCALVGLEIEKVFLDSGFNNHEFQLILSDQQHTDYIMEHKIIQGVSFTGSSLSGRTIAQIAGRHLKRCVLELGGADPFIVTKEADIQLAADLVVASRKDVCGQKCIAPKRILVDKQIADQFVEQVVTRLKNIKLGDPMDRNTQMGLIGRPDLADKLQSQFKQSLEEGAQLVYGGKYEKCVFEPTLIICDRNNICMNQEIFGPIWVVCSLETEQEMIEVANQTEYGLGANLICNDKQKVERMVKQIESGSVWVNDYVKSDIEIPIGGVKASGYGRELGKLGMFEFVNHKSVISKFNI